MNINKKNKRANLVAVVATIAACWSLNATGATAVPCPGSPAATETNRQFFVTPNSDGAGAPVCYLYGDTNGAAGNDSDVILAANPSYKFLDKTGETGGLADGALFAVQDSSSKTPAPGEVAGRFWVDATKLVGFQNFIIAFTTGQPPGITPDYASFKFFNVSECTAADPCDWLTRPDNAGSLSHATLYGTQRVPDPVPIPAAAWLLGSGLLGLFALGRRRRMAVVAA